VCDGAGDMDLPFEPLQHRSFAATSGSRSLRAPDVATRYRGLVDRAHPAAPEQAHQPITRATCCCFSDRESVPEALSSDPFVSALRGRHRGGLSVQRLEGCDWRGGGVPEPPGST